jgi:hypothetical protein
MSTKLRPPLEIEQMEDRLVPTATDFVRGLYFDVFRRVGSDNDVNVWVQQLNGGKTGRDVAAAFINADENHKLQVDALYNTVLNRTVDPNAETFWVQRMRTGTTAAEVERFLLLSNEYLNNHILNSDFVQGVYIDALGRVADPEGAQFWQTALNTGRVSREGFIQAIQNSTEYINRKLDGFYRLYLHRASSSNEQAYWSNLVQSGRATLDQEAIIFLSSIEYESAHGFSG